MAKISLLTLKAGNDKHYKSFQSDYGATKIVMSAKDIKYACGQKQSSIVVGNDKGNSIYGSSKTDWLIGFNGDDIINGNGGNDRVDGGNGNDQCTGGEGSDVLCGGLGGDILNLTEETLSKDSIVYLSANESSADFGIDIIRGFSAEDVIYVPQAAYDAMMTNSWQFYNDFRNLMEFCAGGYMGTIGEGDLRYNMQYTNSDNSRNSGYFSKIDLSIDANNNADYSDDADFHIQFQYNLTDNVNYGNYDHWTSGEWIASSLTMA